MRMKLDVADRPAGEASEIANRTEADLAFELDQLARRDPLRRWRISQRLISYPGAFDPGAARAVHHPGLYLDAQFSLSDHETDVSCPSRRSDARLRFEH